jgi:Tol biopolymer transport system component
MLDLADGSVTDLVSRAGNVGRPSWSPDGSRIVFRVLPPDESVTDVRRLYLVNADGGGLTVLGKEHVEVTDVPTTWTPDGRRIVFWGSGGPGGTALLTMRPDGSDVRPFGTAPPTMADGASVGGVPSWSSDGRWFVIGGLWDHPGPLYLMSVDGRHVFVLENSAGEPRWGPG